MAWVGPVTTSHANSPRPVRLVERVAAFVVSGACASWDRMQARAARRACPQALPALPRCACDAPVAHARAGLLLPRGGRAGLLASSPPLVPSPPAMCLNRPLKPPRIAGYLGNLSPRSADWNVVEVSTVAGPKPCAGYCTHYRGPQYGTSARALESTLPGRRLRPIRVRSTVRACVGQHHTHKARPQ